MSREDAYKAVQRNAMKVWTEGANFLELLCADADVAKLLPRETLAPLFDMTYHTKHVDTVFRRVFGEV